MHVYPIFNFFADVTYLRWSICTCQPYTKAWYEGKSAETSGSDGSTLVSYETGATIIQFRTGYNQIMEHFDDFV